MGQINRVVPIEKGKNAGRLRTQLIENGLSTSIAISDTVDEANVAFESHHLSATQAKPTNARPTKIDIDEWNKIAKQQRLDFAEIYS